MSTFPKGSCSSFGHTFEMLRLHRLEAAIVPRNAASRRVADKLGLRDEGTAPTGSCRSKAFPRTTSVTPSRVRSGANAVMSSSRAFLTPRGSTKTLWRRAPLGSLLALVVGVGLAHRGSRRPSAGVQFDFTVVMRSAA